MKGLLETAKTEEFTSANFYRQLAEGRLMASRCKACESLYLPPRPLCPRCLSADMAWVQMRGMGKLAAFTAISVAPSAMVREGFDRTNPYCSGVVELEEGARISARILGVDAKQPESIAIGKALVLEVLRDTAGKAQPVVAFRPEG